MLSTLHLDADAPPDEFDPDEAVGSPWSAAISSFLFFASGALIPVLPYLFGATGYRRGRHRVRARRARAARDGRDRRHPLGRLAARRALRQLAIGFGAAAPPTLLGLAFGATGI